MLRAILNKYSRQQPYGHLPCITKPMQVTAGQGVNNY